MRDTVEIAGKYLTSLTEWAAIRPEGVDGVLARRIRQAEERLAAVRAVEARAYGLVVAAEMSRTEFYPEEDEPIGPVCPLPMTGRVTVALTPPQLRLVDRALSLTANSGLWHSPGPKPTSALLARTQRAVAEALLHLEVQ